MIKDDMPLSKPCAKVRERERGGGEREELKCGKLYITDYVN